MCFRIRLSFAYCEINEGELQKNGKQTDEITEWDADEYTGLDESEAEGAE